MRIQANETQIFGDWVVTDQGVEHSNEGRRVEELISSYLIEIATSSDGWSVLYRDPVDGRFWSLDYPNGERHGGGPRSLNFISVDEATKRFGSLAHVKKSQPVKEND
jgi:hypothetical protein